VRDLIATVDSALGATPEKLKELMAHVQKLSSVLELTVDCSGTTTTKMVKKLFDTLPNVF
jgi:hypothetical protein